MNLENSEIAESNNSQIENNESDNFDLDAVLNEYLGIEAESSEKHSINTQEVLKELPEDALKLIQNLRKDYTKKTQLISEQKKELEQRERTWLDRQESILRSKINLPEDFDIYAEGGIQRYLDTKVAEMLLEQTQPLREQIELEERRTQLSAFKASNPDIVEYKEEIVLEMSKNPNLDIRSAYYLVKGKSADEKINQIKLDLERAKQDKANSFSKVSTGGVSRAEGTPKFTDASQAYRYLIQQGKI